MDEETILHTISLSRARLLSYLLFSSAFTVVSILGAIYPESISRLSSVIMVRVLSIITSVIFGVLAGYFAALLFIQKRALEISTQGIRVFSLTNTLFFPWPEIESIGNGELPWAGGMIPFVGLTLRNPEEFFKDKPGRMAKLYLALQKKNLPYHTIFTRDWTSITIEDLFSVLAAHFAVSGKGTENAGAPVTGQSAENDKPPVEKS